MGGRTTSKLKVDFNYNRRPAGVKSFPPLRQNQGSRPRPRAYQACRAGFAGRGTHPRVPPNVPTRVRPRPEPWLGSELDLLNSAGLRPALRRALPFPAVRADAVELHAVAAHDEAQ